METDDSASVVGNQIVWLKITKLSTCQDSKFKTQENLQYSDIHNHFKETDNPQIGNQRWVSMIIDISIHMFHAMIRN